MLPACPGKFSCLWPWGLRVLRVMCSGAGRCCCQRLGPSQDRPTPTPRTFGPSGSFSMHLGQACDGFGRSSKVSCSSPTKHASAVPNPFCLKLLILSFFRPYIRWHVGKRWIDTQRGLQLEPFRHRGTFTKFPRSRDGAALLRVARTILARH